METCIQRIALSALVPLLLLSSYISPSFAANISVRITQSTVGPDALPYWAALDRGFFRKFGIDAEIIYVRSGAN